MMNAPKIVQVDRASVTDRFGTHTVWAALREDGSVVTSSTQAYPRNLTEVELPDYHEEPVQVAISCANKHNNMVVDMTVLYADGAMAHTSSHMSYTKQEWTFENITEPAAIT